MFLNLAFNFLYEPCLQVSPKVVVRFTDIRSGLGRTSLSTSFEEKSSPTDVTLRNITKTLCSPRCGTPRSGTKTPRCGTQTPRCGTQTPRCGRQTPRRGILTPQCGTQTPRAMRRVSAGVTPTSSVARKMELSPQVKKRRSDVNISQRGDSINIDEDILLSSSIFDDDDSDGYAIVPKPTRNLKIPEFLLSGGTCRSERRSESVNYRTTDVTSEVSATLRGFAKLKKFQKSKNNFDRAQPTHPPPYPNIFFFWKHISGMARTLKSQLLINNVHTEYITLRSYHMSTHSPHWK